MKIRFSVVLSLFFQRKTFILLVSIFWLSSFCHSQQPKTIIQVGHSEGIQAIVVARNDGFVVTGGSDNTAIVWEAKTGRELVRLVGHRSQINSVAISPNGKIIATASGGGDENNDFRIRLWNAESGQEINKFQTDTRPVKSVAFSPGGGMILSGSSSFGESDNLLKVRDLNTGKDRIPAIKIASEINAVAFSPDGVLAAVAGGGIETDSQTLEIWNLKTGKFVRKLVGHEQWINSVVFSPDGKLLLSGGADNTARLWRVGDGKQIAVFDQHEDWVTSVAFSPNGDFVLTGCADDKARLWNLQTKKIVKEIAAHSSTISGAVFSPDGNSVLLASLDRTASRHLIFQNNELTDQPPIFYKGLVRAIETVAFSEFDPEKSLPSFLTAGEDGIIKLWGLEDGKELRRFDFGKDTAITSAAFAPLAKGEETSRKIAAANSSGDVCLWDTLSGVQLRCFEGHISPVWSLAFSADGKSILTGGGLIGVDNTARLWNAETGEMKGELTGHSNGLLAVDLSGDGRFAATGSLDATARIWNAKTGAELQILEHQDYVTSVVFSPENDLLATGSIDGLIRFWKVSDGRLIKQLSGHQGTVNSLRFTGDGKYLVSGGDDGLIKVWKRESGELFSSLAESAAAVNSLALSADSQFLLSGAADGAAILFDFQQQKEIARMVSFTDNSWTVFTPDGRFDTDDLEDSSGLHYVIPGEPFRTFPITYFARDYFEPRLLPRLIEGDKFNDVQNLAEINRTLPEVSIIKIAPVSEKADLAKIIVEVKKTVSKTQTDPGGKHLTSGVYDLRLFRNGQLVRSLPEADLTQNFSSLTLWREKNKLEPDKNGKAIFEFEVKLPRGEDNRNVEFSAYAFNSDRIKSQTAKKSFLNPNSKQPAKKRAFVISIGVNAAGSPQFDLRYAVNDAVQIQKLIPAGLEKLGLYEQIVNIALISEAKKANGQRTLEPRTATKEIIRGIFELLAGREISEELKRQIPKADQLKAAAPDDLILITYSGHGSVDARGEFYLIPADARIDAGGKVITETLISSTELASWLRTIDAGEITLVVDACYSAASVEGFGFKPAPMGSRGLGQLAYDKGIRILTASQADKVALEAGTDASGQLIEQGLLTFALTREAIESRAADRLETGNLWLRNWLNYGVERVPELYSEIRGGRKGFLINGEIVEDTKERSDVIDLGGVRKQGRQRPTLFDFRRKNRADVLLMKW